MDNLDKALKNLSKIEPEKAFIKASKDRLLHQIKMGGAEVWLVSFLKRIGLVKPSPSFVASARLRLMHRLNTLPQPLRIPLKGFARALSLLKKAVASGLVMVLAVTATLFAVEGKTVVEASDDSYLEVISGTASLRHASLISWENIDKQMEIQSGDLIKVEDGAEVVIHFFDDTELRAKGNSLFLIRQLAVSPGFSQQGVIEIALHEGEVWVQTMNVDDGYAGVKLSTRNTLVDVLNGSIGLSTNLTDPSQVIVLTGKAAVSALDPTTQEKSTSAGISAGQKAVVQTHYNSYTALNASKISEKEANDAWIQRNVERDKKHLDDLRAKGLEHLTLLAGTLPGDALYPVKQAKERLKLAFTDDSALDVKIEIANNRLNEAIVLLERGDVTQGQEALKAYRELSREILTKSTSDNLANQLVVPHQKALVAQLPSDISSGLIKEALGQTAEILAEDPLELEKVKLENALARLRDVMGLLETGEWEAAKERLNSQPLSHENGLEAIEVLEDDELKRTILRDVLALRQEEETLLASISNLLAQQEEGFNNELVALIASATESNTQTIEQVVQVATPLLPELFVQPKLSAEEMRIAEIVDKIYVYKTFTGQKNQLENLLREELSNTMYLDFLRTVRDQLEGRIRDYLNSKILLLQRELEYELEKEAQRAIDRGEMESGF